MGGREMRKESVEVRRKETEAEKIAAALRLKYTRKFIRFSFLRKCE